VAVASWTVEAPPPGTAVTMSLTEVSTGADGEFLRRTYDSAPVRHWLVGMLRTRDPESSLKDGTVVVLLQLRGITCAAGGTGPVDTGSSPAPVTPVDCPTTFVLDPATGAWLTAVQGA
jgi:hypothetical protein